jgi:signal transduction histidine kinase
VEVRIADTGPGLTDDARRRMFVEPFFTTKFRHRGLSLAVVYRMLYAHRGGVQVDSQPGRGTTVRVVLPLAAARVPAVEPGRSTGGPVS